jgi:hypothetical protein
MKYKTNIKIISLTLFLSYILLSCDDKKKLSNEDKIKILTEIFSDKTKPSLFFKKCIFINIQITKPHSMFYNGKDYESYNEYVSEILNVKDIIFINEQIIHNKNLKINSLRNFKFKFQNFEDKKTKENCYVMISKPLFNKNEDRFYTIIQENGTQNQYLFKKNGNKWIVDKKFGLAIE